jgi:phosphoenolpyruvate carboxykinase (ATP)
MNIQPNTSEDLYLTNEELIQEAINNDEGVIASNGAFSTSTGERTGRSPNDRFIVKEAGTKNLIDWGEINKPYEQQKLRGILYFLDLFL